MNKQPLRTLCCLLSCLLMTSPLWADASSWTLEQLMGLLAGIEHRETRFTETRELALLDNSLESTGSLTFEAPDTLRKRFDQPVGTSYEISGSRLTISRADGSLETILLDNAPQLLAYIASLRAVLAGDLLQLKLHFEPDLSGTGDAWLLRLKPRDSQLARQLLRLEINGRQGQIQQFIVIEQGGDRITTSLQAPSEK